MAARRSRTVRINVHLQDNGVAAVGVLRQEWSGPVRLDRRLARAIPLLTVDPAPPGVDPDVWLAWQGLSDVVARMRADHLREEIRRAHP